MPLNNLSNQFASVKSKLTPKVRAESIEST